MNIALWAVAIFVSAGFLVAGGTKLITPRTELHAKGMTYVEDFSDGQIKAIAAVEVVAAIVILGAPFFDPATWLVPVAAAGLAIMMVGAIVVHARRKENFTPALVLGVLAAFLAVGRLWIAPF